MRLPASILFSPVLSFVFAVSLCAQPDSPAVPRVQSGAASAPPAQRLSEPSQPTSDAAEGRIKLDVVVTDNSGNPVSGLESKDFTLLDNGERSRIVSVQTFNGANAKPDPPVEVILVIDAASHSSQLDPDVQPEVERFLRRNGGRLVQPVSIYRFSDTGLWVTPQASTDGNALVAEISHISRLREIVPDRENRKSEVGQSSSSPAFRNPFFHPRSALEALGSIVLEERRKPGRKLLIWVGYGGPVGEDSFDWITEFSTRIREAHIALYSVMFWLNPARSFPYQESLKGVKSARQSNPSDLALEVLAAQSGGRVFEDTSDMAGMIDKCVEDASAFYTVTFNPPQTDQVDDYHDLRIQVDKPGLVARTNSGYYDQPVYYDQPYVAALRVTVDQLEQSLVKARGAFDAETARQLSSTELTEQLTSARLASWKTRVPGAKSWAALVALADTSAFLDPPHAEVSAGPAPDPTAQRQMQSKTIDYLLQKIPKLPDFFAERTTVRYREPAIQEGHTWKTSMGDRSLHLAGSSRATILYRNGYEAVDSIKGSKSEKGKGSLYAKGMFGPILRAAILDAVRSDLIWSRWQQGTDGPRAVFRYSVPKEKSHFEVTYCCLLDDGAGSGAFQDLPGYQGEIEIDPESGAVLRMTMEPDLELNLHPNLPILRTGIVVEYGPVDIGGTSHICLLKTIAILRERTIFDLPEWGERFKTYGAFETMLDDSSFGEYHMFRGQARVLSGFDDAPEKKSPDPSPAHAPVAAPPNPQ